MAKLKRKRITDAELDAALAEIREEQKAWFSAQSLEAATKAKKAALQAAATLALVCRIGNDLDGQSRAY